MSFSIGIVGLPNVGKSTLFKALTKKQVEIADFPFTTIKPNVGVVKVPDERLEKLAKILQPQKIIPTYIEFIDIAGLVKGAHQGEGLGNQFLSHIREVDAIAHVVRFFENPKIVHVAGKIDPLQDIETINLELALADLSTLEKKLEKVRPEARSGKKEAKKLLEIFEKLKKHLERKENLRTLNLNEEEKNLIEDLHLLTLKPIVYVINIDENQIQNIKSAPSSLPEAEKVIMISAKLESELAELPEEERKRYLQEYGLEKSGLDELILVGYQILNLVTFFTTQNNILQAWTIPKDTKVIQAAGKIHSDFEKGFVRAEVISWEDLIKAGGEKIAREKGLIRIEGKDYLVKDGDVICFRVNL